MALAVAHELARTTTPAVRLVGGLFSPDLLEQLRTDPTQLSGQHPRDFGFRDERELLDDIAQTYRAALNLWNVFQRRLERLPETDRATSLTRDAWIVPLLSSLGYELERNPRAYDLAGQTYAISHRASPDEDSPPIHIAGARQELGRIDPSGRPRLSPHTLVQEFLNRSDHLWGIVTNGLTLRLLRSSPQLRTETYLEFDLATLFTDERYTDFVLLYRLLHRTRLPQDTATAHQCILEQYHQQALEQGSRARDRLRDGVERAVLTLGNGFLRHPANSNLREQVRRGELSPQRFYELLLRLVYRLLFLLVTEERGLLGGSEHYRQGYSVERLRRRCEDWRARDDHDDLWAGLLALFAVLRDGQPRHNGRPLAALLDLPVLDGELFRPEPFEDWRLRNRDLLDAIAALSRIPDERGIPRRVNYAALDVEELGSVYESLLDHAPLIELTADEPFTFAPGTQRKTTGSYYTPPELVAALVESALQPVLEARLKRVATREEKRRALLDLKICDPAAGSGHFLLAAARRLARTLARLETGEEEPSPERQREAMREVVTHCLYAVDKNPLAVELCKVALWIEAHLPGQPLTFLDHRIKCGDSLVGVFDLAVLREGIPDAAYERDDRAERSAARGHRQRNRREQQQLPLSAGPLDIDETLFDLGLLVEAVERMPEQTVEERLAKQRAYGELARDERWERLRAACDLWTAAFFADLTQGETVPTTGHVWQALAGQLREPRLLAAAQALASELRFFHWPLEFPDVFARGGFDVVLGNPPFMGGLRISSAFGARYRTWLEATFEPFTGTADLCAAFFRRAFASLAQGGRMGMVATNTISQGDTRQSGLAVILQEGGVITFARRFVKWLGVANVEVSLVSVHKRDNTRVDAHDTAILDGVVVPFISSRLDPDPETEPRRLVSNEGKAFVGDFVRGIGFVLEPSEAERLLSEDPRNANCLLPYLNGEDLNSHPEQRPSRYVICFHDWDLERAKQYPALLRIVEERVKPERDRLRGPGDRRNREYWWQFGAYRTGMRRAIAPLQRVLVRSRVSELHALVFVPHGWVYNEQTIVFAFDDDYHFALLQSTIHEAWVWRQASSLESRNRYTPTDCFDTFPFPMEEYRQLETFGWRMEELPRPFQEAALVGAEYHEHRRQIMLARRQGLTAVYNLFHNPACTDTDIARLRELHAAMDNAVLACYAWPDLDLRHDFYENERGQTRFTISPHARRELLRRLLELNIEISLWEHSAQLHG